MYKITFLFLLISSFAFAQNKGKAINYSKEKNKNDSCSILLNHFSKNWKYNKKGNFFVDSLKLMYDTAFYAAFTKCLINKDKKFVLKLLGKPNNFGDSNNRYFYYYCTSTPYNGPNCCEEFLTIELTKKCLVKRVSLANCRSEQGYRKIIKY